MLIKGIRCNKCKDVIYSRARHDFRECSCGSSFVDGGFEYLRYGGEDVDIVDLIIASTKEKLYEDWNKRIDKFGLVKS